MLVVDFMHEVELGVWKALFMHLIRILYAAAPGGKLVGILDERYNNSKSMRHYHGLIHNRFRSIPLFSQAIRRFTNNVSEMKKLAARDYEDLLQVILFPLMLHNKLTAFLSVPSRRSKVSLMSLIINV
jgi:hypothetical protein